MIVFRKQLLGKKFQQRTSKLFFLLALVYLLSFFLKCDSCQRGSDHRSIEDSNYFASSRTNFTVAFVIDPLLACDEQDALYQAFLKRKRVSERTKQVSTPYLVSTGSRDEPLCEVRFVDGYLAGIPADRFKQPSVCFTVKHGQPVEFPLQALPHTLVSLSAAEWGIAGDWVAKLSDTAIANWRVPKIKLIIFGNNRLQSLERLFKSLSGGLYLDDIESGQIALHIHLDGQAPEEIEQMALNFIANGTFSHLIHTGQVSLQRRISRAGLLHSVMESWYPITEEGQPQSEYAVFLEDDIEVSPLFYHWVKYAILRYRYAGEEQGKLMGISLYTPVVNEIGPKRRSFSPSVLASNSSFTQIDSDPFLLQVPCSWGAAFFPEFWLRFRDYMQSRVGYQSTVNPSAAVEWLKTKLSISNLSAISIPNQSRVNTWNRSWKRHLIELMYYDPHFMLYPKIPFHKDSRRPVISGSLVQDAEVSITYASYSTNHMDKGDHVHSMELSRLNALVSLYKTPLLTLPHFSQRSATLAFNWTLPGRDEIVWPNLAALSNLKTFNLFHRLISSPFSR